jgi:hypothetical protein
MRPIECAVTLLLVACEPRVHGAQPTQCDPLQNTGCGNDEVCRVTTDDATLCLAPEVIPGGASCTARSCAEGEACAQVDGVVRCLRVCALETGDCPGVGVCTWALGERWGLCAEPCRLGAATDCPGLTHCGLSPPLPFPICVPTGQGAAEAPCGPEAPCGRGSGCLDDGQGARCRVLCDDAVLCAGDATCSGGVEGIGGIGYCTP